MDKLTMDKLSSQQCSLLHKGSKGWSVWSDLPDVTNYSVTQIDEDVNAGSNRKVSGYTAPHTVIAWSVSPRSHLKQEVFLYVWKVDRNRKNPTNQ